MHAVSQSGNCHQCATGGVTDGLAESDSRKPHASNSIAAANRYLSTVHHQSETGLLRARDIMGLHLYLLEPVQALNGLFERLAPFLKIGKLVKAGSRR